MAPPHELTRLILLADSDGAWSVATGAGLQTRGWSVVWAPDAQTAAPTARRTLPDVVIVDADLEGGAEGLLHQLRAAADTALIPAVALVADGQEQPLAAAGAQSALRKPVTVDELDDAAKAALELGVTVAAPPPTLLAVEERMRLLEASGLLRGEGDALLDHITALAAALLPAASARISLVADDRQVFAARTDRGGGLHDTGQRSWPLTHSLCQWAVTAREPLVVGDARADPLLAINKSVTELGAVAYLGAPLMVDGQALGTLCVLDSEPRDWQPEHLDLLDTLVVAASAHVRARLARDPREVRAAAADALAALADVVRRNPAALAAEGHAPLAAALTHFAAQLRS